MKNYKKYIYLVGLPIILLVYVSAMYSQSIASKYIYPEKLILKPSISEMM